MENLYFIFLVCLQIGNILNKKNAVAVKSEPTRKIQPRTEPCNVENSFLFTREDVQPGTALMKLPTYRGETWALIETEPKGYLSLDARHGGHSWLVFSHSPDLETISQLSGRRRQSVAFILVCTFHEWIYKYKQELIVSDVNEHAPVFDPERSYDLNISEATSVGSSVLSLRQIATDIDATGQVSFYSLEPYLGPEVDGRQYFQISADGNHMELSRAVDFERLQANGGVTLKLNLSATDNGAPLSLSTCITLTIHVTDVDDQGPAFIFPDCQRVHNFCTLPYFQTAIKCGFKGQLRLYPGPIQAVDRDTQNHSIHYSISRAELEPLTDMVHINKDTGDIQVDGMPCSSNMHELLLTVTATENSSLQHSTSTNVQIKLLDNLVFPNMAWNVQVGADHTSTSNSSLSMVVFLIAVCAFITVGSILAFLAVRISRNKKQNKIQTTANCATLKVDDCHLYNKQLSKAPSCFQTCTYNCSPQVSHSNAGCDSLPATLAIRADRSLDTMSVPAAAESETQEMWTAFRTATANPFLSDITFSPSPSLPGCSDLTSFYDPNCSFGSMKHERTIEGSRHVGRLKLTLTNVVPDYVKSVAQKVRFETSSLNQSNV